MRRGFLKNSAFTDRKRSDEGAIAILVAVALPVCLILLATATDLIHAVESTRKLQTVADQASTLAVLAYTDGNAANFDDMDTIVEASMNRLDRIPTYAVFNLTASGGTGTTQPCPQVRVVLNSTVPTYFSSILGISSLNISRSSIAMLHIKSKGPKGPVTPCSGGSSTWPNNGVELLS